MFRKSLIAALLGLGFGATAQAGLAGGGAPGFSFKGTWADFDAAVNVTATAGSAVGDYLINITNTQLDSSDLAAAVAGLSIPTIGVTSLSGGGFVTQGQLAAPTPDPLNGRFSVASDEGARGSGVFIEGGTAALTIEFQLAIQAFGFWGTDIGDFGDDCGQNCQAPPAMFTVELFKGIDSLGTFNLDGTGTNGSADYYGFVGSGANTFTKVIITNNTAFGTDGSTADGQGFSRFSVGTADTDTTPVPEPGVLGLVALGLLAAGRKRRAD